MTDSRFKDSGERIYDFLFKHNILIECPHCKRCAKGIRKIDSSFGYIMQCRYCGILSNPIVGSWGNGTFMGLNLWLRTNCCGNLLWAYNKEHLDFLNSYINSSLRERIPNINQSLASRLPNWIKSRKNREELSKGIAKLYTRLNECN
ncbi:hypothetical protein DFQ01_1682 [Paenibacillus cellulosilyticus]|uniref:Uncharacterized protein n=1 Tax=Paenibacillus cellulosilyticus TaxID=375489 RepID=A0A2V2Y8A6_9BACL|nr:hypothetical protein [Paenibacillus cellulosilyticus]PWV87038.1 hypothetical protein DFQ01_1682 [Paenibacillus cellulosilyticus]QKS44951.1 hypothetical protein HUB94_11405 [Paenibacillus cellulosilyticus]